MSIVLGDGSEGMDPTIESGFYNFFPSRLPEDSGFPGLLPLEPLSSNPFVIPNLSPPDSPAPVSPAPGSGEPLTKRSKETEVSDENQELFISCVNEGTLPTFFLNINFTCPFCKKTISGGAAKRITHYEDDTFISNLKTTFNKGGNPKPNDFCENLGDLKEKIKGCVKVLVEKTPTINAEYNILQLMCYYLYEGDAKRKNLDKLREIALRAVKVMNDSKSVLSFYFNIDAGTCNVKNRDEIVRIETTKGFDSRRLLPVSSINTGSRVSAFQFV